MQLIRPPRARSDRDTNGLIDALSEIVDTGVPCEELGGTLVIRVLESKYRGVSRDLPPDRAPGADKRDEV